MRQSYISRKKVLIVDDERGVRDTLQKLTNNFGYDCKTAKDGVDAYQKINKEFFDVVVTDIKMPKMGGIELLRKIKKEGLGSDVLIMTGFSAEYTFKEVVKIGATDFIVKPFKSDELEAKLNRIIKERKLKDELLALSIQDSLTGLFNRRHFFQKTNQEMQRAKRQNRELSLILLDIDNFKQYNDTYGHLEGDKALALLGRVIQSSLRKNVDSAFRYGGDEFAILLIETTLHEAVMVAERIRRSFEMMGIGSTTLSLGVAEYNFNYDIETFLNKSDMALYKAKRSGGNQILPDRFGQEAMKKLQFAENM
jgi:diguanylate cyclase (GGDEF)-like protein